jgi:hypothetical protein
MTKGRVALVQSRYWTENRRYLGLAPDDKG